MKDNQNQLQLITVDGKQEIISFAVLPSFHQVTTLDKRGHATAWIDQTTLNRRDSEKFNGQVVLSRDAWETIGKQMNWF